LRVLRTFFVKLSENRTIRGFAERSTIGQKLSSRFVAGTSIHDAVTATQSVNKLGMHVSLDNLGENVTNAEEARQSARLYEQILDEIGRRQLDANVNAARASERCIEESQARNEVTTRAF